ncbi:hypothetical protein TNCV_741861 [Trichonephila clavipes]|nr:hypothetical protein TNCV_741861 [Trichonephila clavipes]
MHHKYCGGGSLVAKVSEKHVMNSSQIPLKTRRVGVRCTLNLSRGSNVFPLVWYLREKLSAHVSSSSLHHGSILQGSSPKTLEHSLATQILLVTDLLLLNLSQVRKTRSESAHTLILRQRKDSGPFKKKFSCIIQSARWFFSAIRTRTHDTSEKE